MLSKLVLARLLVFATLTACATTSVSPTDESAQTDEVPSGGDDAPFPDCGWPIEVAEEPVSGVELVLEESAVDPGTSVAFSIVSAVEYSSDDELIVECWTGSSWKDAWAVFGLFDAEGSTVVVIEPGEDIAFDADGWSESSGIVSIASGAPPGRYRTRLLFLIDGETVEVRTEFTIR